MSIADTQREPRLLSRRAGLIRTGGLDIVGPLVVYQLCRQVGLPEVWALVISGAPPLLGVVLDWARWRALEVVGALVIGGIALQVVLALLSDDPTVVLLEGAAWTAALGVACLASLVRRRPLTFYLAQAFYGGRHSVAGAAMEADYDRYGAGARYYWRIVTTVSGIALLLEAAGKAVVVNSAPTPVALAVTNTAPWLVVGLLFAWSLWWGARIQDGAEPAQAPTEHESTSRQPPGTMEGRKSWPDVSARTPRR